MYDPARDVWNVTESQENDEQSNGIQSSSNDKSGNGKHDIGLSRTGETDQTDTADVAKHDSAAINGAELKKRQIEESKRDTKENTQAPHSPTHAKDKKNRENLTPQQDGSKQDYLKAGTSKEDSPRQDASQQDTSRFTADEHNSNGNDGFSSSQSQTRKMESPPPEEASRKLKKPSTRMSDKEREAKSRELRARLEISERNNVESVRDHYNQRPNTSVKARRDSPIIKLRSFNNFIKSALIERFSFPKAVVLDIGMGKGGDLQKWAKNDVKGIIGVDVADQSLKQAEERYLSMRPGFWADFCVGDPFKDAVENIVVPEAFPVDIVSIQFSMHYAFESEAQARMLLSNVSRVLRKGGRFIGTIPNSDVIMERAAQLEPGQKEFGNSVYKIAFTKEAPKDLKNIFGYEYTFYLEDAVGNVPEYIVPFEAFRGLAQEYHLELVHRKPFLKMFDDELALKPSLGRLCQKMNVLKSDGSFGIEGDQREACGIYLAFAFEKLSSQF
jgi:mRNA (guanine-N7-)-methyltransferase